MSAPQLVPSEKPRLSRQVDLLKAYFRAHPQTWLTPEEASRVCGAAASAVTSRLRDLRKSKYGGWTLDKRKRKSPGLYEYHGTPPGEPTQLSIL